MRPKIKKVVLVLTPVKHFRRCGFTEQQIEERDWNQEVLIDSSLTIVVTPARHASGRGLKKKQALRASY